MLQNIVCIDEVVGLLRSASGADFCEVHLEARPPRTVGIDLRRLDALDHGVGKFHLCGEHGPTRPTTNVEDRFRREAADARTHPLGHPLIARGVVGLSAWSAIIIGVTFFVEIRITHKTRIDPLQQAATAALRLGQGLVQQVARGGDGTIRYRVGDRMPVVRATQAAVNGAHYCPPTDMIIRIPLPTGYSGDLSDLGHFYFLVHLTHDCIGPVLGFDENLRNINSDDADAEDQQSAEEPDREHHRYPARENLAEKELADEQPDAEHARQKGDSDAQIEDGDQRYLAERRDTVNQHAPAAPQAIG